MPSLNIDIPKSRCKGQGKSSRSVSHNIDKVVHEYAQNESRDLRYHLQGI